MGSILLCVVSIFPYQGFVVGGGQWLNKSFELKYRPISPEFSIFVGGWPIVGRKVRNDFLFLFEGGYNMGKKVVVPSLIPEYPEERILFQDLFLGVDALQEIKMRPDFKVLVGGGISWHTLRSYTWGPYVDIMTDARAGFSVHLGVARYITRVFGLIGWLRYTRVFPWDNFDPSRVQFYMGIFQDLRGTLTSTEHL